MQRNCAFLYVTCEKTTADFTCSMSCLTFCTPANVFLSVIACVKMRQLDVDENYSLQGCTLQRAIDEDRKLGLIPFFVSELYLCLATYNYVYNA